MPQVDQFAIAIGVTVIAIFALIALYPATFGPD